MKIEAGVLAPDFTLYSSENEKVTLSQYRDKNVVLLFFPLAFTSVCTAELCTVRDGLSYHNNMDAQIFGISVDSPHTLSKFREVLKLNFQLLSDFNKEVSAAYESLYDTFILNMKGVAKRAAFVIDRKGIIQYAEILENAGAQPDYNKIEDTLLALK